MEDDQIIGLFAAEDPGAVDAAAEKYGAYCRAIAQNILRDPQDAEECVNDAYLNAWRSLADRKPKNLGTYLGKLVRNLAFTRWRRDHAGKRGGGETALILDELGECVSGGEDPGDAYDRKELISAIEQFLRSQPEAKRRMFLRRYWYGDSLDEIAKTFSMTKNAVTMSLSRTREKLQKYLYERGFYV